MSKKNNHINFGEKQIFHYIKTQLNCSHGTCIDSGKNSRCYIKLCDFSIIPQ